METLASDLLQPLVMWGQSKMAFEAWLPFDSRWVHLVIGPVLYLLVALAARKPLSSGVPWIAVALLDLANEGVDLAFVPGPERSTQVWQNLIDFFVTMAIPTAILIVSRWSDDQKAPPGKTA